MEKEDRIERLLQDNENIDLTLSYSRVSSFDIDGPNTLINRTYKDSNALKKGALVDDLLFSKEIYNDKYYTSDFNEPTATLGNLCKIIFNNYRELPEKEEILKIIERNGLWKSVKKEDLILKNFDNDEFWGYMKDKYSCGDRIVVTSNEKIIADEIVSILSTHEYSKSIFDEELQHYYQYPFEIKIKEFNFRGILDIISIDHKNKKVYFKDLKTGAGSSSEFISSFIKWRYYLQEAVYCLAFEEICKKLDLKDYTLEPFEFIYIGFKEKLPIRYIVSQKWHEGALNGFKTSTGYYYKGLYTLIDEIYFHWKNKVFDLPKDVYENKGEIMLKDDFINIINS